MPEIEYIELNFLRIMAVRALPKRVEWSETAMLIVLVTLCAEV